MKTLPVQFLMNSAHKTFKILPPPPPPRRADISFGSDRLTVDYYDKIGSKQREDIAFEQTIKQRNDFLGIVSRFSSKNNPKNINILDAGCGTGRDTKFFIDEGYEVDAFDVSSEMVKRAQSYTGINVSTDEFLTYSSDKKYDGIYARNSLLHVPKDEFIQSVENMTDLLKDEGIFWATLKAGKGELYDKKGRFFSYYSIDELEKMLSKIKDISIVEIKQYNNEANPKDNPIIEFIVKKN